MEGCWQLAIKVNTKLPHACAMLLESLQFGILDAQSIHVSCAPFLDERHQIPNTNVAPGQRRNGINSEVGVACNDPPTVTTSGPSLFKLELAFYYVVPKFLGQCVLMLPNEKVLTCWDYTFDHQQRALEQMAGTNCGWECARSWVITSPTRPSPRKRLA